MFVFIESKLIFNCNLSFLPRKQLKIDQSGGKPDYDLKQQQQQPIRSSPESQNQRNASSVLQNSHPESNNARPTGIPQKQPEYFAKQAAQAKPAVAKRSPTDEPPQKQNGTNGKANVSVKNSQFFFFCIESSENDARLELKMHFEYRMISKHALPVEHLRIRARRTSLEVHHDPE